jgi:polygalacturonase
MALQGPNPKMKRIFLSLLLLCLLSPHSVRPQPLKIPDELSRYYKNLPFSMQPIAVPEFPQRSVSIAEFGAVPDGITMNTTAFAEAIASCARSGGGTVVVPPGAWLTGPIRIESNINLHIERGALVQFSRRIEDFPLVQGLDGKSRRWIITPPLSAFKASNIAITGAGIIDGNGDVWRYVKRYKLTPQQWSDLIASGGVVSADSSEWWPSMEAMEGAEYLKQRASSGKPLSRDDYAHVREFIRPDLVILQECSGVLVDGVTIQNSPRFHLRPSQSENIIIRNVSIRCPWYAQNGDGLDPASCRNLLIYNTTVDVGDDGLCLKPGALGENQKPGPACENIMIIDCTVYHAHGGFVIGSESYGGVNNVFVRNCVFSETDVGLRFKSYRGNGGLVQNVYIDGIQMRGIATDAILFDMYYAGNSPDVEARKDPASHTALPVTERTPRFQNFSVKNVVCTGAARGMLINGLPEMPVRNIAFENVSISSREGAVLADAEGIILRNCRIAPETGPAVKIIQSRSVSIEGGTYGGARVVLSVHGERSGNIHLVGISAADVSGAVELGAGVKPDVIVREK